MALLRILQIDKKVTQSFKRNLDALNTARSTETGYEHHFIDELYNVSANCRSALDTALSEALAEKDRLGKDVFADPVVQGTFERASDDNASFPKRVYDNIDECSALYRSGLRTLTAFEADLRREWNGVSRLSPPERHDFVLLARNKLVATVGVQESLRDEPLAEARKLEEEVKGLEGRLGDAEVTEDDDAVIVEKVM